MELTEDNILNEVRRAMTHAPMFKEKVLVVNVATHDLIIKAINKHFVGVPNDIVISDISSLWGMDIVKADIRDNTFYITIDAYA